ncbi:MAG: aspartate aminotransferase family protein [Candidatus Nezhaarchaeales archaeon]|nr:MAG: aspartate aminotransferase family protein [Candidatus Nezhaarchaeota archaeon WYZ-LMO8]TDA35865.1 MAG: aspartate aminotransferase family protein [Candidatus Nezhaarchaeota archaeon WYZ-LMO7]
MRKGLPKKGLSKEEIIQRLNEYCRDDADPFSGKLFTIAFEPGVEELRAVAFEVLKMFAFKNMLDFTEFPSMIRMEKDLIDIASSLVHGDEQVTGTFTFGGTESVFLAVKAARDRFILSRGMITIPEIVMPVTGHPCYDKAAEYMGLKVKRVRVDEESLTADPDAINEAITENTAMIVGSTPNWPFGTIDPIKDLAEIALDKNIWMHVDACVGGFVLPFMKKLGENIPEFDFRIEGVCSISMDPHKYAYTPIGASIVLFRKKFYKMFSQYANIRWPGYPIVNPAVLSSRSEALLAAAWAILHFLGEEGYMELAKKLVSARNKIVKGLKEIGYKIMGEPSVIAAFTSDELNLFTLCDEMAKKGWLFLPQKGIANMNIPPSVHLTITPIHDDLSDLMISDLKVCTEAVKKMPPREAEGLLEMFGTIFSMLVPGEMDLATLGKILSDMERMVNVYGERILKILGLEKGFPKEMGMIYQLLASLPPEIAELLTNYVVIEIFSRGI